MSHRLALLIASSLSSTNLSCPLSTVGFGAALCMWKIKRVVLRFGVLIMVGWCGKSRESNKVGGHKVVSRHPPTLHGKLKRTLRRTKKKKEQRIAGCWERERES